MFEGIKSSLARRKLLKVRDVESRLVRACGLGSANKVGILHDATDETQFEITRKLLFVLQKQISFVKSLGFVDSKELSDFHLQPLDFSFFCKNDLDWLGFPKDDIVAEFCNTDFDILICLDMEDKIPLNYVKIKSKAGFKVGFYSETNSDLLDVMINLDEENLSIEELVKQILHYLEDIRYE